MKQNLTASQTQQLALTPQLRQALAVLQMSAAELEAEVADAVESNPLLEWEETAAGEMDAEREYPAAETQREESEENEQEDWSAQHDDADWGEHDDDWSPGNSGSSHDEDGESQAERQAAQESLQEHLLWQLGLSHLGPRDMQIGAALIDAIDNDGYLREPLQNIAEALPPQWQIGTDDILPVLHLIQHFDPLAVGSRDLSECLTVQLQSLPDETPARALALKIAAEMIERLPKIGAAGVARECGCDNSEAEAAIALLRTLDPRPGARIGDIDHDAYITPDARIFRQKGRWQVALTRAARPAVAISREYAQMAAEAAGSDGQYLRGRLQEARWLLKNIEQRGETLLRILQCLIREQSAFLEYGQAALRPLTLREIASQLELHESTISRAIARKYVHTPRGTLALRDFFASGIDNEGVAASSTAIQSMIRELIDAENPRKPLSDSALTEKLKEAGIPVARRTVAKYREALGIPSSQERVRL
ncbi:RNA polymerase factor sigma-54 [Lysobacteraceae bacterium NML120232]|nr:RNA polymerase factor sigma-54 [Xanthomonadaceae bacterium NML08-0793]PJK13329.1 RNA polymerase factor sigma-54 [Xanthomonadaceae bacterium NML120232]